MKRPAKDFTIPGCDYEFPFLVTTTFDKDGNAIRCHDVVCARCNHHTGNNNQGHYWAHCSVTKSTREFHFCCPNDCELEVKVEQD